VPGPIYQFADFQLDRGRFELLRNGLSLRVERKPMELLILLVSRQGLLVTRREIADRLWSNEVFVDTEHGINTAIRKLRHLLRDNSDEPKFIQTVTGMGYRFVAPITSIGVPVSDPTPAEASSSVGYAQPEEPEVEIAASPVKPRRFWIALAACSAIVIAIFVLTIGPHPLAARLLRRNVQTLIMSIAVIPLENLSGDPNQEYFADGMTDELITMLAKDSTLRITSRTSVMQYRGVHKPLPVIARALNVDGILEGSISRRNDHVHLTLQLIRADTDAHVWAESYDRSFADAPMLPDEAANAIARELHQAIPTRPATTYVNPEAHDAYLRGRFLWENSQFAEAGKNFLHSVEVQPDYAPGWAGVSEYYAASAVDGLIDPREAWPKAESAVVKSLQLDPTLAEGHSVLAAVFFFYHWDWVRARTEIRRAYELDPHLADNYRLEAKLRSVLNEKAEAVEVQRKAMELNPFVWPWGLVMTYDSLRDYDAALEEGKFRLKTYPENPILLYLLSDVYRCKGMTRESADFLARAMSALGDKQSAQEVKTAFSHGGYEAVVRLQLDALLKRGKSSYASPVEEAEFYAQLGEREKTLALLEAGLSQRAPGLLFIQADPAFDSLHADPRYRSIIQRVGLPPQF